MKGKLVVQLKDTQKRSLRKYRGMPCVTLALYKKFYQYFQ